MNVIEKFMQLLLEKEDESQLSPIFQHGDVAFVYIKYNNVYRKRIESHRSSGSVEICVVLVVCTTKNNANVILVLSFLYKCVRVFCEYFKELEEESIRDNFVIVYELLDELMDFGFPQSTDSKILQEYITQEGHKLEEVRPPPALTQTVSWRSDGLKYRKNEVFLDVIESVNLLVSSNGNVLRSEINGAIKMRVYLSGMPELRLGLNDKVLFETTGRKSRRNETIDSLSLRTGTKNKGVELEDVKFHQCVRLSRFENDRTISFVPPDGEFELMSYRLNTQVKRAESRNIRSRAAFSQGQTVDLDRIVDRKTFAFESRIHDQSEISIQTSFNGE